MAILDLLSSFYNKLENKWFDLLDFLDSKGIPVYSYASFLEEKGIPSMPFTIAILFLLAVIIFSLVSIGTTFDASIALSLKDDLGQSLTGVQLSFFDSSGRELSSIVASDGSTITIEKVRLGQQINVNASKPNYKEQTKQLNVTSKSFLIELELERDFKYIDAYVSLVDAITGTIIRNAVVTANFEDQTITGVPQSDGRFLFSGIRANVAAELIVKAAGYEDFTETYVFTENETKNIAMQPSSIALQGKTMLSITVIDKETQEIVKDVNITIIDDDTEQVITRTIDEDGIYVEKIDTGTIINIVVEKSGYIRYEASGITLREEEYAINAVLEKGGKQLLVNVVGSQNLPIGNAVVQLFDEFNSLLESKETGFSGSVLFTNLNPENSYYVTAFKQGFLPLRKKASIAEEREITLSLEKETTLNASMLKLTVLDNENNKASGASIKFYEIENDLELPLGIPTMQTDALGYLSVKLPVERQLVVRASKGFASGKIEVKLQAGKDLEQTLQMTLLPDVIKVLLKDFEGNTVNGNVKITSISGETLFDGNTENGYIYFNNQGNEEVIATITLPDGTSFNEKINVKGKKQLNLTVLTAETDITPVIEFVSVLNEKGEKIQEIERGSFYWLEFMATFPKESPVGGIHVRVGDDDIQFVDSQDIGILGFQAEVDSFAYGTSYTVKPLPGNESLDRYNKGKANEFNKWLELYFKNPKETKIIKVKVKARENSTIKEFKVKFRAWTEFQGRFFREPYDAVLAQERFSLEKGGLYADTKEVTIKIAEDKPKCSQDFCFDHAFIEPSGVKVEEQDFTPFIGKVYALELRIMPMKDLKASILFETNKEMPSLYFTGIEIDSFTGFPDNASQEVQKAIESLTFASGKERKIRLYFKGFKEENSFIKITITAGTQKEEKTVFFNLNKEHEIRIDVVPQTININEDFVVRLTDIETSEFITNAKINILDQKNKVVRTLIGSNSKNKGLNGEYLFKGNLEYGFYKIEVEAKGYKKAESAIAVSKAGLMEITKETTINLKKDEKTKTAIINLTNKSAFIIRNLSFEFKKMAGSSNDFIFKANTPEMIGAGQTINLQVTAEYQGTEERGHDETELIVRGMIEGLFATEAKGKISTNYNKPLPESCISFDKDELKIEMYAEPNAKENVALKIKNNCNETISLRPDFKTEKKDTQLSLETNEVTLQPSEEKEVTIDVTNKIQRMYYAPQKQRYQLYWIAPQLTKSLPLIISMRSLYFSLQTNDNLVIYIAPDEKMNARGFAPLYIRNAGFKPIENLSFSVEAPTGITLTVIPNEQGYYAINTPLDYVAPVNTSTYNQGLYQQYNVPGYASLNYVNSRHPYTGYRMPEYLPASNEQLPYNPYFTPSTAFTPFNEMLGYQQSLYSKALMPGQELTPVKTVIAIARNMKSLNQGPYLGRILISGTIDGKRYYLKAVNVWIHVSGTECLKAYALESLNFESTEINEQEIARKIKLKNECSETLRGLIVEPKDIGGNALSIESGYTLAIAPNQEISTRLVLKKSQKYASKEGIQDKIVIIGQTTATLKKITSNALNVNVRLGEIPQETGKKTIAVKIPLCEDEKIFEEISFPLKSKTDCSEGYCDAVHASESIAKTIKNVYEIAIRRARQGNNNSANFGCLKSASYCPYSGLGVPMVTKELFLLNDKVTTALIKDNVSRLDSDVKGYDVGVGEINVEDITTAFKARQILVSNEIRGCGRYRLEFDGTMKNAQGKLIEDEQTIIIRVKKIGGKTAECTPEIYNLLNFLPEDKGLPADTIKAVPGTVYYDLKTSTEEAKMRDLAEIFSQAFFGTKDRIKENRINSMHIITKDLGDKIVELKIEGAYTTEELIPTTITATINNAYLETKNNETANRIKNEIAQAINSIAAEQKDRDICITKDKKTFRMRSLGTDLGKVIIKGDNSIELKAIGETCTEFTVESKLAGNIVLSSELKKAEVHENIDLGFAKLEFKNEKDKEKSTLEIIEEGKVRLPLKEEKTRLYSAKAKICISLDEKALKPVKPTSETEIMIMPIEVLLDSKINVNAVHETSKSYKADTHAIIPKLCSIHPEDLIEKMPELKDKSKDQKGSDYYLTLEWKNYKDIINKEAFKKQFQNIHVEKDVAGTIAAEEKRKVSEKISGIGAYLLHCSYVSFLGNTILKFGVGSVFGIIDPLLDCGIPAAIGLAATIGERGIGKVINFIPKLILSGVKNVLVKIPFAETFFGKKFVENAEKDFMTVKDQMISAAAADVTAKAIARAITMRETLTRYSRLPAFLEGNAKRFAGQATEKAIARLLGIDLSRETSQLFTAGLPQTLTRYQNKTLLEAIEGGARPIQEIMLQVQKGQANLGTKLYDVIERRINAAIQRQLKEQLRFNSLTARQVDLLKTDIIQKAVQETINSDEVLTAVMNNLNEIEKISGPDIGGKIKEIRNELVNSRANEMIDPNKLLKGTSRIEIKDPNLNPGDAVKSAKNTISRNLPKSMSKAEADKLLSFIDEAFVNESITTTEGTKILNQEDLYRRIAESLNPENKIIQQEALKEIKKSTKLKTGIKGILQESAAGMNPEDLYSFKALTMSKLARMGSQLTGGILVGALANYWGMQKLKEEREKFAVAPGKENVINLPDLKKYMTYKIKVIGDVKKNGKYEITELKTLEEFIEMREKIKDKKAENIDSKCERQQALSEEFIREIEAIEGKTQ